MAKIETLIKTCDVCASATKPRDVEAKTVTTTINGKSFEIELCEKHTNQLITPLHEALLAHGRTVRNKARKVSAATSRPRTYTADVDGNYPCPEPGCDKSFTSPQGIGRHRTVHD